MGRYGQPIHVRFTLREREALGRMAAKEGRTLSDMIRECIRREAQRQGVWPEADGGEGK